MPTVTAQTIISRASVLLQDTNNVRWPQAELLEWLNDGQREVVSLRPDAYPTVGNVTLVAGTRQTLPPEGIMLVDVVRNMGTDGTTPGRAIRKVPREMLDTHQPDWHSMTSAAATLHYTFDPKAPRTFYVYPPAQADRRVECLYSTNPPDVAAVGNVITLEDIYSNALIDYVCFRAYSKDAEHADNAARAAAYRQSFENTLGLKAQSDAANVKNPNIKG